MVHVVGQVSDEGLQGVGVLSGAQLFERMRGRNRLDHIPVQYNRQPLSASSLGVPTQSSNAYRANLATTASKCSDAHITGSSTRWVTAISR
jgi:hypothetical protein